MGPVQSLVHVGLISATLGVRFVTLGMSRVRGARSGAREGARARRTRASTAAAAAAVAAAAAHYILERGAIRRMDLSNSEGAIEAPRAAISHRAAISLRDAISPRQLVQRELLCEMGAQLGEVKCLLIVGTHTLRSAEAYSGLQRSAVVSSQLWQLAIIRAPPGSFSELLRAPSPTSSELLLRAHPSSSFSKAITGHTWRIESSSQSRMSAAVGSDQRTSKLKL